MLGYSGSEVSARHADVGVAPNELTSAELRDPFAGTPWHKSTSRSTSNASAADVGVLSTASRSPRTQAISSPTPLRVLIEFKLPSSRV